jgi:hypothetical protein
MGLDIYFHKVKKARKSKEEPLKTISEYSDILNQRAKEKLARYAKRSLKKLTNAIDKGEYVDEYHKIFPKGISRFTQYDFKYKKFCESMRPIEEVRAFFDDLQRFHYAEEDAYFRKVNFIYHYFQPKLVDECAFVTKADLEDIIERCDKILEGVDIRKEIPYEKIDLAMELLPTQSGFFFGSTDYDKWYFADVKDVRRQMKKLLRGFNEDTDVIYVVMSW